ncbi:MAG TPA: GNAT family N-acetyltransferase [Thermoplasmata archaeon]|nr:GNAT family N-acetyltransferase [Thermoplasmata archaeon]
MARLVSDQPHIRAARFADLGTLARMWEELEKHHVDLGGPEYRVARGWKGEWQRFARNHIGRKDRLCLVAEPDGRAIGFLLGAVLERPKVFERRRYGHIYDVFVDAARRNRGVGEALANAALEWFRAHRVDRVELYAHTRNESGLRFWKRMGFETTVYILDRRN